VFLGSMMVPGVITMVPTFLVLRHFPLVGGNDLFGDGGFGFINTYWAVILPGAAGPFAVFFMKQFFESLPDELGEAARIDGAGEFRIFLRIILPLCRPALAVVAIFSVIWRWNDFLWPLIVAQDESVYTLPVALARFSGQLVVPFHLVLAMSVLSIGPVIVLFLLLQRQIVAGIAQTGLK
jgi:ABC-type glycerol-3-phosphate transport system permease component